MRLNFSTSAAGSIQVELQDERGAPLEGRTLQDADLIFGDRLDMPLAWKGKTDLCSIAGRPVRVRFLLRDADIYAFRAVKTR